METTPVETGFPEHDVAALPSASASGDEDFETHVWATSPGYAKALARGRR